MATILINDPLDIALDDDGDMLIDADGLHLVSGLVGVAQLCRIALLLFKEEWFLNLDKGMPWYQEILGEKFSEEIVRRRATEILLGVPGVLSINLLVVDFSIDHLSITSSVKTQFGDTEPDTLAVVTGGS